MGEQRITARERDVLGLIAKGLSTKEIAFELGISFKTSACHRARLMEKLSARNTADMVVRALAARLINLHEIGEEFSRARTHLPEEIQRVQTAIRSAREELMREIHISRHLRREMTQARHEYSEARKAIADTVANLLHVTRP